MFKKLMPIVAVASLAILFSSCDVSKKIKENQTDISTLKEEVRLLKESVSNYEKAVNGLSALSAEVDSLKREIAAVKQNPHKPKAVSPTKKTAVKSRRR